MTTRRKRIHRSHAPVSPGSFAGGLIMGAGILFGMQKAVEFLTHPRTAEIVDNFNKAIAQKR